MTNPIDLHYWPTPNGWKITIALHEMGLEYRLHLVDISAGDQFEPEFLAIAPNNRMPAIVDPDGPDGKPISVFESGAILLYLGRKTGLFYGSDERERVEIEQWLMWQMGGVGPMAGQAHHFLKYAPAMEPPNDLPYAKDRYRNEVERLYGVLDRRLADRGLRRGAVFYRGHGDLAVGEPVGGAAAGHRELPAHEGLARSRRRAPGCQGGAGRRGRPTVERRRREEIPRDPVREAPRLLITRCR